MDVNLKLAAALEYHGLGMSVIPCCDGAHLVLPGGTHNRECGPQKRGKVPLIKWKKYQTERATVSQIGAWWGLWPHANPAVVMGAVSACVSFDIDDANGWAAFQELSGGEICATWQAQTGGGGARLFFGWPGDLPPPPAHWQTPTKPLHFLSTGFYSVMPPSTHYSGNSYKWKKGRAPADVALAPISPRLWGEIEARARKSKPRERGGGAAPVPDMTDEAWRKRARGVARRWQGGKTGEGGRDVAFALACALVHGCRQPVEAALSIMLECWNDRCEPPWPEGELRKKVESARVTGHWEWRGPDTYRPVLEPAERVYMKDVQYVPQGPDGRLAPVAPDATPHPDPPGYHPGNSRKGSGRLASELRHNPTRWLVEPWVPLGKLSAIVGLPNAGKSTFGAWLVAGAGRSIILPGREEDPEDELFGRLGAHDAPLDDVLIADDRDWLFPLHRDEFCDLVRGHRADLVWIDPISSYFDESTEINPHNCRAALESLAYVAIKLGVAVVFARHPGKEPGNLMPGSREWRAVPRVILEVLLDEGPPLRRIIRPWKDSPGRHAPPTLFHLDGEEGEPLTWRWGEPISKRVVENLKSETDVLVRRKVDRAMCLLRSLLADDCMDARAVYQAGAAEALNDRCMERAHHELGGMYHRSGRGTAHRCVWYIPGWTPWVPPTPDIRQSAREGG